MSDTIEIIQGDSSTILDIYVQDEDGNNTTLDSNWKCYKGVCDMLGSGRTMLVEETEVSLSDDNLYFPVGLTPTESASLDEGYCYLVVEVSNDTLTPPYKKEYHRKIKITSEGITTP